MVFKFLDFAVWVTLLSFCTYILVQYNKIVATKCCPYNFIILFYISSDLCFYFQADDGCI